MLEQEPVAGENAYAVTTGREPMHPHVAPPVDAHRGTTRGVGRAVGRQANEGHATQVDGDVVATHGEQRGVG